MGEEYKTDIEKELELVLEAKGYFCLNPDKQTLGNMALADEEELPDFDEYAQLQESEFLPDDVKSFLQPIADEKMKKRSEMQKEKSSVGGMLGRMEFIMNNLIDFAWSNTGDDVLVKQKDWARN
ncbi:hypothetical protein KY338_05795 [Candidatus Woesearchaeota archaeon]|nr:hypothetical protein [Candidatus Woesearchaeota archaeon]MBW3006270.1 hypothetical protein [Candidatus Woesearchaeota archaeon]